MLVGFNARVRAGPRAAGACFPLSACPWEVLPGFSARVRAEPRAACACFPLPACRREAIPKLGGGLVQVQGRAQSSWVLFSPCCLSLGKCGSCVMPCFPSRVHARNPLGSLELGQSCAVELCSQAVAFHCSRD